MRFISVCSGIEAASVAWEPLGFKAVAFSEIDPFCCSLLSQRFPDVPNYGDMTRYEEWPNETPVDIAIGGTPCQSFSIAGLRGGLQDDRGNLALIYCRILQKYKPRWFVWENVPGCLSSFSDEEACSQEAFDTASSESEELWQSSDFVSMLSAFRECGYCIAGRILDAQYFGVPQRRRRVFIVGYRGDWRYPAEVLFEPESVQGNTWSRKKTRKSCSATLTKGFGDRGVDSCQIINGNAVVVGTLTKRHDSSPCVDRGSNCVVTAVSSTLTIRIGNTVDSDCTTTLVVSSSGNKSLCLNAGMGRQDLETETMILSGIGVRKLLPVECERLQGFPDNHTLVEYRGGMASDGPRYSAIGNSMAVPVIRWIGERILRIDQRIRSVDRIG